MRGRWVGVRILFLQYTEAFTGVRRFLGLGMFGLGWPGWPGLGRDTGC